METATDKTGMRSGEDNSNGDRQEPVKKINILLRGMSLHGGLTVRKRGKIGNKIIMPSCAVSMGFVHACVDEIML